MVRITEELVRRRSEHNEGILHSLRELTLHQFEIERIELLGTLCRHLQILYLQNNLIGRIENLHRLKELDYLNLAVNNISLIENLEGCECLRKLDLTVNFIDVDSLEASCDNLRACTSLRELYLMGNPCTLFAQWRLYVIGRLPQLEIIDGVDVTKSERIIARQQADALRAALEVAVCDKRDNPPAVAPEHTPEARTQMYREMAAKRDAGKADGPAEEAFKAAADPMAEAQQMLSTPGREDADGSLPKQRNPGRWLFEIDDDHPEHLTATIGVPRYLDTSQIDVDVHPLWFQVFIKGKIILLHLPVEVCSDRATVQRVTTTGALVIKMPRTTAARDRRVTVKAASSKRHSDGADFRGIVRPRASAQISEAIERDFNEDEVPPLE